MRSMARNHAPRRAAWVSAGTGDTGSEQFGIEDFTPAHAARALHAPRARDRFLDQALERADATARIALS